MIVFVEKKRERSFCIQQKYWIISCNNVWNFNETLTNDVVSFKQPGPGL